jgi:hypothetical protein
MPVPAPFAPAPIPNCHGLKADGTPCRSTDFCNAHILPRAFVRDIKGTDKHGILVGKRRVVPTQHGVFDPAILVLCIGRPAMRDCLSRLKEKAVLPAGYGGSAMPG